VLRESEKIDGRLYQAKEDAEEERERFLKNRDFKQQRRQRKQLAPPQSKQFFEDEIFGEASNTYSLS
jgi:hypothetical protein